MTMLAKCAASARDTLGFSHSVHSRILVKLLIYIYIYIYIYIFLKNKGVDPPNIPLMDTRCEPKSGLKVLKRKDSRSIFALVFLSAFGRKKPIC